MFPIVMYGYASTEHRFSGLHFSGKSLDDAKANARFYFSRLKEGWEPGFRDDMPAQDVLDVWSMGRRRHV
jgi:hypothetical protein